MHHQAATCAAAVPCCLTIMCCANQHRIRHIVLRVWSEVVSRNADTAVRRFRRTHGVDRYDVQTTLSPNRGGTRSGRESLALQSRHAFFAAWPPCLVECQRTPVCGPCTSGSIAHGSVLHPVEAIRVPHACRRPFGMVNRPTEAAAVAATSILKRSELPVNLPSSHGSHHPAATRPATAACWRLLSMPSLNPV